MIMPKLYCIGMPVKNVNPDLWRGGGLPCKSGKIQSTLFKKNRGRGGGVRQSGKFPDYTGFFLLKASLNYKRQIINTSWCGIIFIKGSVPVNIIQIYHFCRSRWRSSSLIFLNVH
jgi:hypothetical protein